MKVNGKMMKEIDMEYIIIQMEINMKENGKMVNLMDMEYIIFQMEINMKVYGKMIKEMDMEYSIFQMEINMKVNGKMVNLMDMEYIIFILLIGKIKENGFRNGFRTLYISKGLKYKRNWNIIPKFSWFFKGIFLHLNIIY